MNLLISTKIAKNQNDTFGSPLSRALLLYMYLGINDAHDSWVMNTIMLPLQNPLYMVEL